MVYYFGEQGLGNKTTRGPAVLESSTAPACFAPRGRRGSVHNSNTVTRQGVEKHKRPTTWPAMCHIPQGGL